LAQRPTIQTVLYWSSKLSKEHYFILLGKPNVFSQNKLHRSSARRIRAGVPQGSILGPILFNICVCDLPISLRSTLALFTDDTALISQDRNIDSAIDVHQTETNLLLNWFSDWEIALYPQKCEAKIFSLRKFHVEENIQIHNNAIPWNDSARTVKYLGVLLDTKLTYKHHINSKLNQANSRLAQIPSSTKTLLLKLNAQY
jgi:hypothetical protein